MLSLHRSKESQPLDSLICCLADGYSLIIVCGYVVCMQSYHESKATTSDIHHSTKWIKQVVHQSLNVQFSCSRWVLMLITTFTCAGYDPGSPTMSFFKSHLTFFWNGIVNLAPCEWIAKMIHLSCENAPPARQRTSRTPCAAAQKTRTAVHCSNIVVIVQKKKYSCLFFGLPWAGCLSHRFRTVVMLFLLFHLRES